MRSVAWSKFTMFKAITIVRLRLDEALYGVWLERC